ncbi:MAG: alpha-L-fucosidase [Acidobacteriota bacterium]
MKHLLRIALIGALSLLLASPRLQAQTKVGNKPERLEWFRDLAFGMFIHWNVDGTLGGVISHSLVGASKDYSDRYFADLPKLFNPRKYNPDEWAELAKLAGMQYVVFTSKHHAGFCMWDTKTTPFNVMNTPYGKDLQKELVAAFRKQGIAVGFYFSPDDFLWLYKNGKPVARHPHPGVTPAENPGLLELDKAQIRELLKNYGKIDFFFIDGPEGGLRELCWELDPDIVVTRGAIETPEQFIPGLPLAGAWEANLTMGTEWPYKPTNETYKSGQSLIRTLIETRAKGGNLLLNVGPKPDGELPIEQEDRLREVALWMFVNREAIWNTRPWVVTNEDGVWFTSNKTQDTLYVIVTDAWKYGEPKTLTLKSVAATGKTTISVLGQTGDLVEYRPQVKPEASFTQTPEGLKLTAWKAQRLYTNNQWPNPVVIKLTNIKSGVTPPVIQTIAARWDAAKKAVIVEGKLDDLGKVAAVEVGFQYRVRPEATEFTSRPWTATALVSRTATGTFTQEIRGLEAGQRYQFQAIVKHPLLTLTAKDVVLTIPQS